MANMNAPLKKAIILAGGPANIARKLKITSQAISQWEVAPANRCIDLENMTNGKVTRHQLRPDIFGSKRTEAA